MASDWLHEARRTQLSGPSFVQRALDAPDDDGDAVIRDDFAPAPAPSRSLPAGVPMDVDASWQRSSTPLLCRRCGKPGHFAHYCSQGLEVCYLSPTEQEELLMQLLAAKDAAGMPLLDMAVPEPPSEEAVNAAIPLPEAEEDF